MSYIMCISFYVSSYAIPYILTLCANYENLKYGGIHMSLWSQLTYENLGGTIHLDAYNNS